MAKRIGGSRTPTPPPVDRTPSPPAKGPSNVRTPPKDGKDRFEPPTTRGGLAASQSRLLMLTSRKSDLELQQQFVSQSRMQLANLSSGLFNQQAKLDPGSPAAKLLQARISSLQAVDKTLEMQMKRLDTQHQAVQTEMESVQKVIQKNIETSFKLMG